MTIFRSTFGFDCDSLGLTNIIPQQLLYQFQYNAGVVTSVPYRLDLHISIQFSSLDEKTFVRIEKRRESFYVRLTSIHRHQRLG